VRSGPVHSASLACNSFLSRSDLRPKPMACLSPSRRGRALLASPSAERISSPGGSASKHVPSRWGSPAALQAAVLKTRAPVAIEEEKQCLLGAYTTL
jgi:hypothetical protein